MEGKMDHKELWKTAFGDTDRYIGFYFDEKAARSRIYSKYVDGTLASMAFFTPYEVMYRGRECIFPYIVGVATAPAYRRRGFMRRLLEQGLSEAREQGCEAAFLCPADEKIYEPLGFRGVQYRTQLEVSGHAHGWYAVHAFSELTPKEKKEAAEFAAACLRKSGFDLYMKRSVPYYECVQKEMTALDGAVTVLREGGEIRAVAAYIYEEGRYEVTEVVCPTVYARKVVESLCAYLVGESQEKILFSDGQFLGSVEGAGVVRKKEQKPYIMLRELSGTGAIEGLRVYINDIT